MTRCVFCDGTGVHLCPGGELGADYFRWLSEAYPDPCAFSTFSAPERAWFAPGAIDAEYAPKPPDELGIKVLSRMSDKGKET